MQLRQAIAVRPYLEKVKRERVSDEGERVMRERDEEESDEGERVIR